MTKILTTEDWDTINLSFEKMNQKYPHAFPSENTPTYRLTSVEGVKEQIDERQVGESVFYMDYFSEVPKISKCTIVEE